MNKWASSENLDLYPFWPFWGSEEHKIRTKETLERQITKIWKLLLLNFICKFLHLTLSSTRESRELRIASNKESGLEGENKDSQVVSNKESGLEGGSKEPWVVTTKNQGRERKKSCD